MHDNYVLDARRSRKNVLMSPENKCTLFVVFVADLNGRQAHNIKRAFFTHRYWMVPTRQRGRFEAASIASGECLVLGELICQGTVIRIGKLNELVLRLR